MLYTVFLFPSVLRPAYFSTVLSQCSQDQARNKWEVNVLTVNFASTRAGVKAYLNACISETAQNTWSFLRRKTFNALYIIPNIT